MFWRAQAPMTLAKRFARQNAPKPQERMAF